MPSIIVVLVVIAAALVMASGVWVATVLLRAVMRDKAANRNPPTNTRP